MTGIAAQNGITITTGDVTLDLCGFSLVGVTGSFHGIEVLSGLENVTIKNGTLRNWNGSGVEAVGAAKVRLDELSSCSNSGGGLRAGQNALVSNSRVIDNGSRGILVMNGSEIRSCIARGNGGHSIQTGGGGCSIFDSICDSNLANGFFSNGSNTFKNCTANGNVGVGFTIGGGTTLIGCTATENGGIGIRADGTATISSCSASSNTGAGISVDANATVLNCTTSNNGAAGVHATGSKNRLEANHSVDNVRGFDVDGTLNLVVKNSACGNTVLNYDIVAGNQVGTLTSNPATAPPWANFDCSSKN